MLGADHIIDYTRDDVTRLDQCYDLILAVNGYHPIADYLRILSPEGRYVVAGGSMRQLFQAALQGRRTAKTGGQTISIVSLVQNRQDLILLKDLLESGQVVPVIDGCYPLSKIAEAFWYFEKEHAKGKVVITL
ncbi:MAG: zinc-binding dehydrogenase [Anaerolineae bacterium]